MTEPLDISLNAFFEAGQEEQQSPFLTPRSRTWALYLPLKAALFAAFLLFLAYLSSWVGWGSAITALLLIFVYFLAGVPSLVESLEDLASFQINIDVLMTLAAFGSVIIGSPKEGALLLVLFAISGAMEETVTKKAKESIRSLHRLAPTRASVVGDDGICIERAITEVPIHSKVLVRAGQVIPLDGTVIDGASSVNLVHLTGENLPVTKKHGDSVQAGSLNLEGALVISVTHTSSDSTIARIIKLVTQAQEAKPRLQRWFDDLSKTYAMTIIALAACFALILPFLLKLPFLGQGGSIYRSLAFLIAASPCALIIAIPIAYLSAIGACARKGILLKGGVVLDALAACQAIAFDKTGTLTTGDLVCLGFVPLENKSKTDAALDIAFALEQNAVHPIAQAITTYAASLNRRPYPISNFRSVPGYGLEAHAGKIPVYLGNVEFILPKLQSAQQKEELEERLSSLEAQGELVALLLIDQELFIFRFQDRVRSEAKRTLLALRDDNYRLMMLTGDHRESAKRIADQLGIQDVYANLKPEDKLRIVAEEAKQNGLAMVGDGINDAPALARATVGISMGKMGASAAIEASDVVLLQDHFERLDWLMRKAKATQTVVRQNLLIATCAIFAASIPALAGIVPLWLAVLLHEGGTVLVGLNGLRLLRA
jgi:heavy metal translocating P-type ATPase